MMLFNMNYRFKKNRSYIIFIVVLLCSINNLYAQQKTNPNGYNKFYYPEGTISSEGNLVNGKPEGYWKTYYKSGKLKSEGNRRDYLLDSIWKFYNEEGILNKEISYEKDKKNGVTNTFSKEGYIVSKEYFIDDKQEGFSYYFKGNGELNKKIFFEKNKENGAGYEFDKKGNIIAILKYEHGFLKSRENINALDKTGKKQGRWKEFYPCPEPCNEEYKVSLEGRYTDDLKDGFFREFDKRGIVLSTTKYKNGEIVENAEELQLLDIETDYYDNASKKAVRSYKNGLPEGAFRFYDTTGAIIGGEWYKNGVLLGKGIINEKGIKQGYWKEYYGSGNLRSEGMYENGLRTGKWKFYYENGNLEQEGKYTKSQKPTGLWKWYYENGKILREEIFLNGVEEGLLIEYSDSGKIITKGEFYNGEKEGVWFYELGDHKEEGEYKGDRRVGVWKHYYSNGNLNFEGKYTDGLPDEKHVYYYANGKKMVEGKYVMGEKEGEWKHYNSAGEIVVEIKYKNGIEKKVDGVKIKPETE